MRYHFPDLLKSHPHLREEILRLGKLDTSRVYIDLPEDFKFDATPPTPAIIATKKSIAPLPFDPDFEWPLLLRPLKLLAKPDDTGLGDIAKHIIGDENSDAFEKWFKQFFGKQCGCVQRREWLNRRYPLAPKCP